MQATFAFHVFLFNDVGESTLVCICGTVPVYCLREPGQRHVCMLDTTVKT